MDKPIFLVLIMVWNIITFTLYGLDKQFAKKHMYRISEKTLIASSLALGGVGAFAGMKLFRHKTKHTKFKIIVPLSAVITITAVFAARYI